MSSGFHPDRIVRPYINSEYWYCACGTMNPGENEKCIKCNIEKSKLLEISSERYLDSKMQEHTGKQSVIFPAFYDHRCVGCATVQHMNRVL